MSGFRQLFNGIFLVNGRICTKNLVQGINVYGERLFSENGSEYREWVPFRSKLAAAVKKNLKTVPINNAAKVLYLGIAEGTTASHVSDIIGNDGLIVGIDISEKTMRKLLGICEQRKNIIPIIADANQPDRYVESLEHIKFDIIFQDVSQKNQVDILRKNAEIFLKPNGFALLALKAKSISSTSNVKNIFEVQEIELKKHFKIIERVNLEPFEKDHMFYVLQKL
ncbi:MAG: fibrillin [Candidatus Diapherotrites archaeon CG08_land_8_20_14_0_20_34_12]|nr:MAG: fibrillin [Candidatus Diapherotrites archaeon CG08_land_8_20_14_0_20_34_12]